ncbi:MAG: iron-siderophore ABC transporter substrate-binding protein [Komarekiella atlantica HA4396-MV6]|jgi:iron complex transport system substrate-binding protein|nr:iron-siderophore ABC transporter substrate-binding protein [Komarekiella atlantica HA4396-MV6]
MGETCIPKNPKRVVTIYHMTLANALLLGIKPIGSATTQGVQKDIPPYLKRRMAGIKQLQLGSQYQTNPERILLAKPDLILGSSTLRETYSITSQISPTVVINWHGESSWREYFHSQAEVLGKEEAEQQAWNHYYQRISELKAALNNRYENKTVSVIYVLRVSPIIHISIKNSFVGSILEDIGIKRPKAQNIVVSGGSYQITEENLEDINGDVIFVLSDDKKTIEALREKPLWKKIKAVQQGHVYFVDDWTWTASNLIAADAVIDDLYKYLVKTH